ncbi:MAG: tRNA preQ1(34) S-adenosylmethionine ribosyltransferase-isomerase QueA [Burkholderiaceae bacterium]
MQALRLSDFDYELPPELIAQSPTAARSASRLLSVSNLKERFLTDLHFTDLPSLLRPGDLLVFNDSKVIPARLHAAKDTGGAVEILVERVLDSTRALVMLRASKKPAAGALLMLKKASMPDHAVRLLGRDPEHDDRFQVDFRAPVFDVLDSHGELPLPPYIAHEPTAQDANRYQTVYAQHPGSVAAPTAGLHFDEAMLSALSNMGINTARVTLHVGSGTFAPVRSEDLREHRMHSEWCAMNEDTAKKITRAKEAGQRVIAVGTTSLRTLESAAARGSTWQAGEWETDLFITPGYSFKAVDALITNFHLPKSTLLMLVSAFAGHDRIREAYAHAIAQRYRFFSYGDAMFLERDSKRD